MRTMEPPWALPTTLLTMSSAVGPPSATGRQSMVSMSHMMVLWEPAEATPEPTAAFRAPVGRTEVGLRGGGVFLHDGLLGAPKFGLHLLEVEVAEVGVAIAVVGEDKE